MAMPSFKIDCSVCLIKLLIGTDEGMVKSMGWTPAVTDGDIRQAQLEAAFRQQMAGEQEYFPLGY